MIVGVFYGHSDELSGHYKRLQKEHPVDVGTNFWHRLTGHINFYQRITDAIGDVATETDGTELVEETINSLAQQIEDSFNN